MRPRSLLALTATAAVGLGAAPAAYGHAEIEARTPPPGKTVPKAKKVSIRFSQSLTTGLITVTRGGTEVPARVSGVAPKRKSVLRARFARPLPRGTYTVSWRALAPDGHRQAGTWRFTVR